MNKKLIPVILIIVLGFAVYGNSIGGKFLWDDEYLIKFSAYVRSFSYLPQIFSQEIGAGSGRVFGFYRPVQIMTYIVDHAVGGLNETAYHVTNIILHILAALAVYFLIRALFGEILIALITAGLFTVHPVNVAVVSYISGRADSLALVFMLLTFILYIRNQKRDEPFIHVAVVMSYALALLSKELALILPILILVYHAAFKVKVRIKIYLPVVLTALAYIITRSTVLKHTIVSMPAELHGTLLQRLPGIFVALFNYMRLLVLPFDLRMEYGTSFFTFADWRAWAGMAIAVILVGFALRKKNTALVSFGLLWFIVSILPVSNLIPLNAYMAEHWLYLPEIGIFLLAAGGLYSLYKRPSLKIAAVAIPVALALFYSSLTIQQNTYWQGPIPFYQRTLKYAPNSMKALNDLGRLYEARGMVKEAAELYEKAIKVEPRFPLPYNNLGVLYHNLGDDAKAVPLYETAIRLQPNYGDALNNLAVTYHGMKRYDDAIIYYKKAIEANPYFAGAYNNMGSVYMSLGKLDEAIEACNRAIAIDPQFAAAHYNLALIYYNARRPELAVEHFDRAIALGFKAPDPAFAGALKQFRKQ